MTETAKVALEKVLALRQLTHDNQTKTTRSQNAVLQSLSETELIEVSQALNKHKNQHGW